MEMARMASPARTMNNFELLSFSDSDRLAQAAASEWVRDLGKVPRGTPYLVALSGGRIARNFFIALVNLLSSATKTVKTEPPDLLREVHFFWADERCVPPSDPESNFAVARELLFAPLALNEAQIHRIRGEAPPEIAAAEAESQLRRIAPANAQGQPVLDLIFLGMGEDGHVASLFPGEPEEVMSSKAVYRPVTASKPPPHRITLGYPALAAARDVRVLASGAGKQKALQESLLPAGRTPLARVLQLRRHTKIFADIRPQ